MPIAKLDNATAQQLASSVNITSPVDLVKELVDNTIDAQADLIEIWTSPNTLDEIRVRDNGHGISTGDLGSLGKPAHTSKLQTFVQLTTDGVHTLGFRGQAISSVNTVATVHITTKTTKDPVATRVRLADGGGVAERYHPVPGAVGTTVRASRLFENMPPRRQLLLKECKKSMVKMREMLTAYAMANPALRIVFKTIGDDRHAWKCGRPGSSDVKYRVMEIFGKELADSCESHSFRDGASPFVLEAMLPKADCAVDAIRGKGSFISVNGRPISSAYGFGKRAWSQFKTQFKEARGGNGSMPQKPFFLVRIRCSPALYDANVASMKDDVLFADERALLECFEKQCQTAYAGDRASTNPDQDMKTNEAQARIQHRNESPVTAAPVIDTPIVAAKMRTVVKVNMGRTDSATDEDDTMINVFIPEKQPEEMEPEQPKPRGIERYFPPVADFDIAVDATATSERLTGSSPVTSRIEAAVRRPLEPLSASAINIMANHVESGDIGSPENNARHQSSSNRRHPLPMGPPLAQTWQTLGSPSPPSSPLIRGQRSGATMNTARPAVLHTPPSSDARNEGRFAVSQEGPIPRLAPSFAPLRGLPPRRTPQSVRTPGSQVIRRTEASGRMPRLGTAARATRVRDATEHRHAGVPDDSGVPTEHEDLWRQFTTLRDSESDTEAMAMDPVEYSHFAQVKLMQSPPRSVVGSTREERFTFNDHRRDTSKESNRRRSRSRSRSRTSLSLLPLEKTPFGMQTFDVAITRRCSVAEIQRQVHMYMS